MKEKKRTAIQFVSYFAIVCPMEGNRISIRKNRVIIIKRGRKLRMMIRSRMFRKSRNMARTCDGLWGSVCIFWLMLPLTSSSSIVVLLSVDSLTLEPSLFLLMMLRPVKTTRQFLFLFFFPYYLSCAIRKTEKQK